MAKWVATCTCGDDSEPVEADTKEGAVDKIMEQMTPEAVAAHMAEKHPGQAVPSQEEARAGVEATVHEV